VDNSLVSKREDEHDEARLWMLETVREYGIEKLEQTGAADEFRQRHAEYVRRLCEQAEGPLTGEERGEEEYSWIDRLQEENGNLRTALAWSLEAGQHELALQIAAAAAWFWHGRNYTEGRTWLSRVLDATKQQVSVARARALTMAAMLASAQGDERQALKVNAEALAQCRQVGYTRGEARCLLNQTYSALVLADDLERVQELAADARAVAITTGSAALIGDAVGVMAAVIAEGGDYRTAHALSEEALMWKRKTRAPSWIGVGLMNVGWFATFEGKHRRARQALEEALTLSRHKGSIANCHTNLGVVGLSEGKPDEAAAAFRRALILCRELGERRTSAEALRGIAATAAASDAPNRAAFLAGVADGLLEDAGGRLADSERLMEDRYLVTARSALGNAAWNSAWAQGRATPLEEAIEYVLSPDSSAIEGAD
jgi:tetratricopeptide (TPR) repeat protein